MNQNYLFLLDAYTLIFRAYYGLINNPLINSNNLNTSAIFGFINSLLKLIKTENPTHLGVCFDVGKKNFRHKIFPEYKINRHKTPVAISKSIPYIEKILSAMNIFTLKIDGYEADDLIGTLAKKAEKDNFQVFIVTYDKDFSQLVSKSIFIYQPSYRYINTKILGVEEIKHKFRIQDPLQIIDLFSMMGDLVDNIPGFPGIGKKIANQLLEEFGSLENILNNIKKIKGSKTKKNIENNIKIGLLSKKLVTIDTDVPIKFDSSQLILKIPNWRKMQLLFNNLELNKLYKSAYSVYNNYFNLFFQ